MSEEGKGYRVRARYSLGSFLMAIGTLTADVGLLLGRAAAMGTGDVLFLLGLGLHLCLLTGIGFPLGTTLEGYATSRDYCIYIVSTKHVHNSIGNRKTENGKRKTENGER